MKLGLGSRAAQRQDSKLSVIRRTSPRVAQRCVTFGSKATKGANSYRREEEKTVQPGSTVQSKLTAMMTAVMPFVLALPADAHEYQRYFQLGAPGLAVVFGSLAYAAATPLTPKRRFATATAVAQDQEVTAEIPTAEIQKLVKANDAAQSESSSPTVPAAAHNTAQSVSQSAHSPVEGLSEVTASQTAPEEAMTATFSAQPEAKTAKTEEKPKFLEEGMEPEFGRGRQSSLVFGGQYGRTGSTQQNKEAGSLQENPLAKEKGTLNAPPKASESKPVQVAQAIVSHVIEWSGLDAREVKPVVAKTGTARVQGNVVPLHKSGERKDKAEKELVVLAASAPEVAQKAEESGIPVVVASAVPLTPSSISSTPKKASQLQEEHKERINGLRTAISSIKGVGATAAVTAPAQAQPPPQEAQQKAYDAKVSALKQSAVQKKKEQEEQWQRRANIVEKVTKATQERLQAGVVKPYNAIMHVKSQQPSGLAKFHPKALLNSILERVVNVWRLMIRAAQRFVGQKPSNAQKPSNPGLQT